MKKRLAALFIILVLLLSILPAGAAGDAELVVEVPDSMPKAGETFTVTVKLQNNPGFNAIDLTLAYNAAQVTCLAVDLGELLQGTLSASNPNAADGARISAATVKTITDNGRIAVYSFTAKIDLSAVPVSIAVADLSNEAGISLPDTWRFNESGENPTSGGEGTPAIEDTSEKEEAPETIAQVDLEISFPDTVGHWGREWISKAAALGLFKGSDDGNFYPDAGCTRAQFVTVLYRLAGEPETAGENPFSDVAAGIWYENAVCWAYEKGYVNGIGNGTFCPDVNISRQEVLTILFRYDGGESGMELMFGSIYDGAFTDSGEIAAWAKSAMYWGVYNGLITGTSQTTLSPTGIAGRAQLAKITVSYLEMKNK